MPDVEALREDNLLLGVFLGKCDMSQWLCTKRAGTIGHLRAYHFSKMGATRAGEASLSQGGGISLFRV